eukprot:Gb_36583 [translate_table: standard]
MTLTPCLTVLAPSPRSSKVLRDRGPIEKAVASRGGTHGPARPRGGSGRLGKTRDEAQGTKELRGGQQRSAEDGRGCPRCATTCRGHAGPGNKTVKQQKSMGVYKHQQLIQTAAPNKVVSHALCKISSPPSYCSNTPAKNFSPPSSHTKLLSPKNFTPKTMKKNSQVLESMSEWLLPYLRMLLQAPPKSPPKVLPIQSDGMSLETKGGACKGDYASSLM